MGLGIRRLLTGVALACACVSAPAQGGLRLSVQQVWSGLNTNQWNPFYANIENQGSNENAVLTTSIDQDQTNIEYPVELPSGSKKRVMFLMGGYNDGKIYLRLSSSVKEATIKSTFGSEQSRIGLISDNPSDLIFLKGQSSSGNDNNNNAIGVGGCIPEDAPDRFMGYDCLDALVLGDGTERLRDEQIRAIKQYVRSGGVLLFVGGAAPSASGDPRWRDIMPVQSSTVVTRNNLTERVGQAVANAKKIDISKGSAYTRSFGVGLVASLSVNPFESPIRESEDRRSIVSKVIQRNHHDQVQKMLYSQIGQDTDDYSSYAYSSRPAPVAARASGTATSAIASSSPRVAAFSRPEADPFQIKPPSISNIMWILIAYTIIVVPINFLVLRKLNKLEYAWISTPVISVVFSAILLNSTIGLYKASATTRTTSVAVLDSEAPDAIVFGRSEMFFPRAKSYDLKLHGVETILEERGYGRSGSSGVNLIDSGREIIAPEVHTGNLAFKDLSYAQSSEELSGIKISLRRTGGDQVVRIQNQSHATVAGISIYTPGTQKFEQKPLASGASIEFKINDLLKVKPAQNKDQMNLTWQDVAASMPNKVIVFASVDEMHVGPTYGEGHPSSQYAFVSAPLWEDR